MIGKVSPQGTTWKAGSGTCMGPGAASRTCQPAPGGRVARPAELEPSLRPAEAAHPAAMARHPGRAADLLVADRKTFVTGQDSPWRTEPRYSGQSARSGCA